MGRIIVAGGSRAAVPVVGIQAGTLAVGSIVKLRENGTLVDYRIVNQGKPGNSSLYDASCNGTWLLRENIYDLMQWHTSNHNAYAACSINGFLNGQFYNAFGETEKAAIKRVKIPYCVGGGEFGVPSGGRGLQVYVFLPSPIELGCDVSEWNGMETDAAKLAYFEFGTSDGAMNMRHAKFNEKFSSYWTRLPETGWGSRDSAYLVGDNGRFYSDTCITKSGVRPAFVIASAALISPASMELVGVA